VRPALRPIGQLAVAFYLTQVPLTQLRSPGPFNPADDGLVAVGHTADTVLAAEPSPAAMREKWSDHMTNDALWPPERKRPRIGGLAILPMELAKAYVHDREMRPLIDTFVDLEPSFWGPFTEAEMDARATEQERIAEQIDHLIAERIWAEMPRLRLWDRIDREQVAELAKLRTAKLIHLVCPP
jgi:hypothetical protein